MTRDEAIKAIRDNWPCERYTMLREALDVAIAALSTPAPSVTVSTGREIAVQVEEYVPPAPPGDLVAILRKAQDFVALANTVWTEDSDGRWAAKLADKRMAVLAEEIAAFPLPEVPK